MSYPVVDVLFHEPGARVILAVSLVTYAVSLGTANFRVASRQCSRVAAAEKWRDLALLADCLLTAALVWALWHLSGHPLRFNGTVWTCSGVMGYSEEWVLWIAAPIQIVVFVFLIVTDVSITPERASSRSRSLVWGLQTVGLIVAAYFVFAPGV